MYFTDRGIEGLEKPTRRRKSHPRLGGRSVPEFVDLTPISRPVERLATWLASATTTKGGVRSYGTRAFIDTGKSTADDDYRSRTPRRHHSAWLSPSTHHPSRYSVRLQALDHA